MAKYKNISNFKVLLTVNDKLVSITPSEVVDLPFVSTNYYNVLVEVLDKPVKKSEPEDSLEDCVVIVSDAIIEELKEDKESSKRAKSRKN
jgi:hypothetical protein